jgi:hypothetical protein
METNLVFSEMLKNKDFLGTFGWVLGNINDPVEKVEYGRLLSSALKEEIKGLKSENKQPDEAASLKIRNLTELRQLVEFDVAIVQGGKTIEDVDHALEKFFGDVKAGVKKAAGNVKSTAKDVGETFRQVRAKRKKDGEKK